MMNTFFNIEAGMQTKLNSIVGKPFIDFEGGKPYTPVLGTKFWRTTNLAGSSSQVTAGALKEHLGVYQIDVFAPLGKGLKTILQDLDAIASAFDTINSIASNGTNIQILGVSRGRIQTEDAWLHGFVKINYICYSN